MSIGARCGSCARELLLGQLVQSSDGFRCPFCGFAFAPAYATVAPGVAARVMAAQAALVTELAELGSMPGDRLRLDRTTILDPIADTCLRSKPSNPRWPASIVLAGGPAALPHSPPNHPARLKVHRERGALPGRCGSKDHVVGSPRLAARCSCEPPGQVLHGPTQSRTGRGRGADLRRVSGVKLA